VAVDLFTGHMEWRFPGIVDYARVRPQDDGRFRPSLHRRPERRFRDFKILDTG
jgi:hypothetical protein